LTTALLTAFTFTTTVETGEKVGGCVADPPTAPAPGVAIVATAANARMTTPSRVLRCRRFGTFEEWMLPVTTRVGSLEGASQVYGAHAERR
jgi:hypothetical protein